MTLTLWTFINILLGVFALGTAVGVTATFLGVTISAHYHKRVEGSDGDEPS